MRPEELTTLLTSLGAAADVVEAIDCPAIQKHRGWNLTHWTYNLVPWGVRFVHDDGEHPEVSTVVALALPEFSAARS